LLELDPAARVQSVVGAALATYCPSVALVQKPAFALFGDFARPVKHVRFPAQTRESPHFRASTRPIVKHIFRTHRTAESAFDSIDRFEVARVRITDVGRRALASDRSR